MHNSPYRADVARQQTTYNQPAYTSFYLASDINWANVPVPHYWAPGSVGALRDLLDGFVASGEVSGPVVRRLYDSLGDAERELDRGDTRDAVRELERFVSDVEHPGRRSDVAPAARAALTYRAGTVIAMLS